MVAKCNLLYFELKHRKVTKFKNRNIMENFIDAHVLKYSELAVEGGKCL